MGRLFLIFSTFAFASAVHAASLTAPGVRPNVYHGAFNIAGSLTFNGDASGNTYTTLDTEAEYFFTPIIAAGAEFQILSAFGSSTVLAGPVGDYYFYTKGRMVAAGGGALLYYNSGASGVSGGSFWDIQPHGKAYYFITPSVAFGPAFYYDLWVGAPSGAKNGYRLTASFSIFL